MRWLPTLALGAVVLVGGYAGWRVYEGRHRPEAPPPPPVPVSAVQASIRDVPVFLRGIGTAQALQAVEVRARVGGVLLDVPVQEGEEVAKDSVLAVIDPRPFKAALDKAQAQRQQDQAQLANAQADLRRYSSLARSDFASRQQVETQESAVARLQGVVAADDASIEEARLNLEYCVLRAPMAGRVGLRRVDAGNLIQANSTGPGIVSVVQDRPIAVVFTLPDGDLPRVREAMRGGPLDVLADSSDGRTELAQGTLLTPDNAVNQATGTIQLKASFPNADLRLTPGMFVSVRLRVDTAHGVSVPHEAVQHGQDGLFVFAIKPDGTAERRDVEVLYDDGTLAVLAQGLKDGEGVVTSGTTRIGRGTRVTTQREGEAPPAPPPARSAQR